MDCVTLNTDDDQALYIVATTLAELAQEIKNGVVAEDLADLLVVASMTIAATMAGAYERANPEFGLN